MRVAGKSSKPTFFWQGVLILLPVIIMAGVALAVISQDRAAVELENRRRAREFAEQFKSIIEQRLPAELARLDALSDAWTAASSARQSWPGERPDIAATQSNYNALLATWEADYPDLLITNCLPNYVEFNVDRSVRYPPGQDFPPAPAKFPLEFSPQQRNAWESLKQANIENAAEREIDRRLQTFMTTSPSAEASLNAQVIALRNRLPRLPANEAVNQAVDFIQSNHLMTCSEAGVPLSALLMNDAVRYSRKIGPSKALWDGIDYIVQTNPSFMTPLLLHEVEDIATGNPSLEQAVNSWQNRWQSQKQIRELASTFRQSVPVHTPVEGSFWVTPGTNRWFCLTSPKWIGSTHSRSNLVTTLHLYPRSFLAEAILHSLRQSILLLPNYLDATVMLNGDPISVSPPAQLPYADTMHELLGQADGELTQLLHPATPKPAVETRSESTVDYGPTPVPPPFYVDIVLINPAAMLAQHHHRAVILGGLILGSAFAAFVGFLAARRAFVRQLQLSDAKSNFVSSVSHELRAPIASVRLMAESLERGKVQESQKQNQYFQFIVQECRRLSSLIENVLDFSRIEQGRKQYEFEPTDLAALVHETVKLMEPYAAERGVGLVFSPSPPRSGGEGRGEVVLRDQGENSALRTPRSELDLDGRAIQQALVNLIDNAIKHSPKGSLVKVEFEWNEQCVRLWVEDNGPGIPLEEHEKIFERFYRLGSELRRETQGVGIGLSIVKHIVEAHGGHVTVRSNPGHGSRFTIELPAINAKAPGSEGAKDL